MMIKVFKVFKVLRVLKVLKVLKVKCQKKICFLLAFHLTFRIFAEYLVKSEKWVLKV